VVRLLEEDLEKKKLKHKGFPESKKQKRQRRFDAYVETCENSLKKRKRLLEKMSKELESNKFFKQMNYTSMMILTFKTIDCKLRVDMACVNRAELVDTEKENVIMFRVMPACHPDKILWKNFILTVGFF
jgi:hypothetical protein